MGVVTLQHLGALEGGLVGHVLLVRGSEVGGYRVLLSSDLVRSVTCKGDGARRPSYGPEVPRSTGPFARLSPRHVARRRPTEFSNADSG